MYMSKTIRLTQALGPITRQTLSARFAGTQPGSGGIRKDQPGRGPPIPIEYEEVPLAEGVAITVKPPKDIEKKESGYDPNLRDPDSTYDRAAERGSQYAEDIKDKARDLKDRAEDQYESMKDRASYNAGRASQKVQDMAHDAKEKLTNMEFEENYIHRKGFPDSLDKPYPPGDTYESAKESASYQAGSATQKAKDMAHDAKEKLSDMTEAAKEKVIEAKDTIKEKFHQASKKLKGEE